MSEIIKGDTSHPMTTNASNLAATPVIPKTASVVKNPLLSASVTGLSFDDLPNKPLLLPPVAVNRDPKPLVTIGSRTDVDSESLDEINLNTTSEETQSTTDSSANTGHIDPNANQLWTESNNQPTDSILTQAASSFSALPSVASSVLSTFSKRISEYSGSNSRERTPTSDNGNIASQLDIQPAYLQQQFHIQPPPTQQQQQQLQQQQPSIQQQYSFYNNPQTPITAATVPTATPPFATSESNAALLPPSEPPKFYTPTEVPILPVANATPSTPASGQNTYRLAAKKKLYAPIPGLSEQQTAAGFAAPPTIDPLSSAPPLHGIPPLPTQSAVPTDPFGYPTQLNPYEPSYQQAAHSFRQEERKTSGGLFANISNLVPTGVLSNISGLVQTATGSFTQTTNKSTAEELTQPQLYGYQQTPSEFGTSGAGQYFGVNVVQPPAYVPHPTQTYPAPPIDFNQPAAAFFAPIPTSQAPPPPVGTAQLHPSQPAPSANASQPSYLFAQSPVSGSQSVPPPPTTGFISTPPKSATPESNKQRPSASTTPITYFDPTKQPTTTAALIGLAATQSPAQATAPPPTVTALPPSAVPTFDTTSSVFHQTNSPFAEPPRVLTPAAGVQQQSNQESQVSAAPTESVNFPSPQTPSIFLPPTAQTTVTTNPAPLPPAAGVSTSFRLQKGTRLYKSPLTSAETAPVQVQAGGSIQPLAPPASFFNPFGLQTSASSPNPLLAPTESAVPTLVPSYFIPQAAESSVGLFAVDKQEEVKKVTKVLEPPKLGAAKVEEPQLEPLSTTTSVESKESSKELSLTSEDLGVIIQQQTIEVVLPEVTSATNLATEKDNILSETKSKVENQSEVLHKALEQLKVKAEPEELTSEQESVQLLATESALNGEQTIPDKQGPQAQQQPLQAVHALTEPQDLYNPQAFQSVLTYTEDQLKIPEGSEGPITELDRQPLLSAETSQTTFLEKQPTEGKEPQIGRSSLPKVQPDLSQAVQPPQIQNTPAINPLLPPVNLPSQQSQNSNPFRRSVGASPFAPVTQPSTGTQPKLANFFSDALGVTSSGVAEFKLFTPSQQLFPAETQPSTIASADSTQKSSVPPPVPTVTAAQPNAAGLFGFVDPTQRSSFPQPVLTQKATEFPPLPPQSGIAPPPLTHEPPTTTELADNTSLLGIPPPLGFDNLLPTREFVATASPLPATETSVVKTSLPTDVVQQTEIQQSSVVNSFSNYFNQTSNITTQSEQSQKENKQQTKIVSPPTATTSPAHFFDTFAQPQPQTQEQQQQQQAEQRKHQTQAQSNEDQRLQNFFNNPPQPENNAGVGDIGYDLVHSGLTVRHLESFTSVSKIVEPPSSSCSEFSEWNNSSVSARNFPAEIFAKRSLEKSVTAAEPQPEVPQLQVQAAAEYREFADPPAVTTNTKSTSGLAALKNYADLPEEILRELGMANMLIGEKAAASAPPTTLPYSPAVKHWFYKRPTGTNKFVWTPFSHYDSALLETTLNMGANAPNIVAVEGGRYDVNIKERTKVPVYWEGSKIEVRRCSWFYKGTDSKMVPYEEAIADLLENEYKQAVESGEWHKKIVLSMNEQVTFHGPTVIVHFQQQQSSDAWGGTSQTTTRPRVVKRDLDDFTIEQGESQHVDHLLLMVHGIGAACDLKMRSVDEVVDDFRQIAQNLVQSHYKNSTEMGLVGRVEVLPISWHSHLHSEEMGIDEKLRSITLESIPKLRNFTNNTILDVLLYTSPKFCQKIMNTVAASMNEVYNKYRERHPEFNGGVSVAGHSLGSLILFDLLCHQKAPKESEENLENPDQLSTSPMDVSNDDTSVTSYTMGHAGTGQPFIHYAPLSFQPKKFFALGSPIGMFVTIRGIDNLGLDFRLPTCAGFYNIFHPFDPVAYRVEALVNPDLSGVRPVLIPHHKGRKRMHLELKETMTRVGADLKQRFLDTFKNTLESVNFLGGSTRSNREAEENITKEVDEVISMQIEAEKQLQQSSHSNNADNQQPSISQTNNETSRIRSDSVSTSHSDSDLVEIDFPLGKLNDSKRIDYVLQEAPLEFINEYIFALGAHVCYWESEDTILFVMKEIYTGLGISTDSQVPQQTMTIERPSSRNSNTLSPITEKR